jgi:quercetin dioxygenase-like cupin family protein
MYVLAATGASLILAAVLTARLAAEPATAAQPTAEKEKGKEEVVAIQKVEKTEVEHFDDKKQIDYPWGWIRWMVTAKQNPGAEMTYGIVYIKPYEMNPLHMHPNCTEYLHVLEGGCEHLVGDKWVTLKPGDVARIPKAVQHMARTRGEGMKAVIVYDSGDRQFVQLGEGKED